jgi:hypothetical protein
MRRPLALLVVMFWSVSGSVLLRAAPAEAVAAIELALTVAECDPDPSDPDDPECPEICGAEDTLVLVPGFGTGAIPGGHRLKFCHQARNTGSVPLDLHTVFNSATGPVISNFSFTLNAGGSIFVTSKLEVSGDVDVLATWSASTSDGSMQTSVAASAGVRYDLDGDETPDASDECPSDAAKKEAGACGCGLADVDLDGNGTLDCDATGKARFLVGALRVKVKKLKGSSKPGARQRVVRAEAEAGLAALLLHLQAATDEIVLADPGADLAALRDAVQGSVTAALDLSSGSFGTNKKAARQALDELAAALGSD